MGGLVGDGEGFEVGDSGLASVTSTNAVHPRAIVEENGDLAKRREVDLESLPAHCLEPMHGATEQFALFVIAVTFTWLMGLMGFARSGIRQHWHVWEVMRDTSPQAFTPALGYAANMISACVLIFLGLVAFIFWLGSLAEHVTHRDTGVRAPASVGIGLSMPTRVLGD